MFLGKLYGQQGQAQGEAVLADLSRHPADRPVSRHQVGASFRRG